MDNSNPDKRACFTLRLDPAVKEHLASLARKNKRSLNSEAIIAIESYIAQEGKNTEDAGNTDLPVPEQSIFDFAGCLADKMTPVQAKQTLDKLRDQDNND